MLYVVNAAVDNLVTGEIIDIDPRLFADYIEAEFISPVDAEGNRLVGVDGRPADGPGAPGPMDERRDDVTEDHETPTPLDDTDPVE